MTTAYLETENIPRLAYCYVPAAGAGKNLPTVMFCGGFRSDMQGTKALYLEQQCRERGQAYLRFDYSGHGESGGSFEDGTIGLWAAQALMLLDKLTAGPVIIVGSSMGGWIALLAALARPERIAGMVGIAAAPDFTREIRGQLDETQKRQIAAQGYIDVPSAYSAEPYRITRKLLDDGDGRCLLDSPIDLPIPVRLLQGMKDEDVPWQTAYRIRNALTRPELAEVILVESGDHRLSRPEDLALLGQQVAALSGVCGSLSCNPAGLQR